MHNPWQGGRAIIADTDARSDRLGDVPKRASGMDILVSYEHVRKRLAVQTTDEWRTAKDTIGGRCGNADTHHGAYACVYRSSV